jgi:hypothetical protein
MAREALWMQPAVMRTIPECCLVKITDDPKRKPIPAFFSVKFPLEFTVSFDDLTQLAPVAEFVPERLMFVAVRAEDYPRLQAVESLLSPRSIVMVLNGAPPTENRRTSAFASTINWKWQPSDGATIVARVGWWWFVARALTLRDLETFRDRTLEAIPLMRLIAARKRRPDLIVADTLDFAQDEARRWLFRRLNLADVVTRFNHQQTLILSQHFVLLQRLFDLIQSGALVVNDGAMKRLAPMLTEPPTEPAIAPFHPLTNLARFALLERVAFVPKNGSKTLVPVTTDTQRTYERTEVVAVKDDGTVAVMPVLREGWQMVAHTQEGSFTEADCADFAKRYRLPDLPTIDQVVAQPKRQRILEALAWWEEAIAERTGNTLRAFQRDDLLRLLFKGYGVLAWDPGLGKTLAGYLFALTAITASLAKPRVVIVAPQDLIPQWLFEARKFFGADFANEWLIVRNVEDAIALWHYARRLPKDHPLFVLTYYEAVRDRFGKDEPIEREDGSLCPLCRRQVKRNRCLSGCPYDGAEYRKRSRDTAWFLKKIVKGGVLVVDEATYIKSAESQRGVAVRRLVTAKCRLLLTGTPIKNLLSDLPMLLQLAAKPKSLAYPFPPESEGIERFTRQFMVIETNLETRRKRVVPEPTNIARIQRLVSAIVLCRNKDQTGERIVPLTIRREEVELSKEQVAWYQAWCDDELFERWFWETHAKPVSPLAEILLRLTKLAFVISHPTSTTARGDPVPLTQLRSLPPLTWATPKNRVTVELVKDAVQETGYCVLFAQTVGVLPVLAAQLMARGIPVHLTVKTSRDGKVQSVSPPERARIIQDFREYGGVLLASISAMAHGHDLSFVSRAVLHSLPFAYDHYAQAILRVHRLISERPVVVHVLCATNTLDEYLLSLLQRKEAAARTVLASSLLRDATAITPEEWKRLWRQVVDAAERL